MSKRWMAGAALGVLSGLAMGQPAAFTISHGDSTFGFTSASALGAIGGNTNRTGTGGGASAFFTVDGSTVDHLFQNWWWYRVAGSSREFAFSNFVSQSGGGSNQTLTYSEVEGVRAVLTFSIQDQGVGAIVEQRMVVTNMNTAGNMELELFNYADFDVGGTAGGDSADLMAPERMRITDGANFAEFQGVASTAYQVTSFATLRGLLSNASVDNLNNTGLPFGPGDWTGAFQWSSIMLAPGQSFTVVERLSVNVAVPTPGGAALLAMAGAVCLRRRRS